MSDEARPQGREDAEMMMIGAQSEDDVSGGAASSRSDRRASVAPRPAHPFVYLSISRCLAAGLSLACGVAFGMLFGIPGIGLALRALLATVLGLLVGLAVLQHLAQRETTVLDSELKRAQQLAKLNSSVIAAFAMAIDAKDQHTHGHTERVRRIARLIGEEVGLNADELQALETAAMLHDIGKLAVPDYILSKPGTLTQEEMKKVETHALVGAAILEPVQFPWPVIPIIRSHHEWYDGSGYPDRLAGDQIALGARILPYEK